MIVLISFPELEAALVGKVAEEIGIGEHVRYITDATPCAIEGLHRKMKFTKKAYPKVLVLNLDDADNDWRAMLKTLKARDGWRKIPVLGFSFLQDPTAVEDFYAMRGASLIRKPQTVDDLRIIMKTAMKYWLNVATLPTDYLTQY